MLKTTLSLVLLALFFAFVVAVFRARGPLWKRLLLLAAPVILVGCCAVNLGNAWYSSDPEWYNVLTTAVYLLFWLSFTIAAPRSAFMTKCCLAMSILTLCAAVTGLLVRGPGWDIFTLPAVLLTPFSTLSLYGLYHFTDSWVVMELISAALSLLWLCVSSYLLRRQK